MTEYNRLLQRRDKLIADIEQLEKDLKNDMYAVAYGTGRQLDGTPHARVSAPDKVGDLASDIADGIIPRQLEDEADNLRLRRERLNMVNAELCRIRAAIDSLDLCEGFVLRRVVLENAPIEQMPSEGKAQLYQDAPISWYKRLLKDGTRHVREQLANTQH